MEIPPQFIPTDQRVAPETGNYNSHLIVYVIKDSIKDAIQRRAGQAQLPARPTVIAVARNGPRWSIQACGKFAGQRGYALFTTNDSGS